MKTAEEHAEEWFKYSPRVPVVTQAFVAMVKEAQLDAMRYGMEQAANMFKTRLEEIEKEFRRPWTLDWQKAIKVVSEASKTAQLP